MEINERYSRQILVPQIGNEGQEKLSRAGIFVVGAGGLGSPALTYLAAAGVGRLGFIDSDTVTLSNLNRQFLYHFSDINLNKADCARKTLAGLNDEIELVSYDERLTEKNAQQLFADYDIILGATDSFESRFIINSACAALRKPYIDGGVNGFSGCVIFSNPPQTPCLTCVFPNKTVKSEPVGVLGTTAGVIGTFQANIALLLLLGLPNPVLNKLLLFDGLRMSFDYIDVKRNDKCPVCGGIK